MFPPCPILHKLEGNRDDLSDGFPEIRYGHKPFVLQGFYHGKIDAGRLRRIWRG